MHGGGSRQFVRDAVRSEADPREEQIIHYLKTAKAWIATSSPGVDDALDPTSRAIAPRQYLTDGRWEWPADLAYYVRRYHVRLPDEFIAHMERNNFEPPELDDDDMERLDLWLGLVVGE